MFLELAHQVISAITTANHIQPLGNLLSFSIRMDDLYLRYRIRIKKGLPHVERRSQHKEYFHFSTSESDIIDIVVFQENRQAVCICLN